MQDTNNLKKLSNHFNPQDCAECNAITQDAKTPKGWVILICQNDYCILFLVVHGQSKKSGRQSKRHC